MDRQAWRGLSLYLVSRARRRVRPCSAEGIAHSKGRLHPLILDADNGQAMGAARLEGLLEALGGLRCFSRPRVSNDDARSESLFPTVSTGRVPQAALPERGGSPRQGGVVDGVAQSPAPTQRTGTGFLSPSCPGVWAGPRATSMARGSIHSRLASAECGLDQTPHQLKTY